MFQAFIKKIENELENSNDKAIFVPRMRDFMKTALADENFIDECVNLCLSSIETCHDKSQWICPPIYHNHEKRIAIRLIPWPAFYSNNPHRHKTWGVTGVFFNKLNIFTYELVSENPVRLKKDRNIAALQYEAGYIMPDCIHSIGNPSGKTSLSIHIFNNLDEIKNSEDNAIWYPSPSKENLREGIITRALLAFSDCLSELSIDNRINSLKRIFNLGDKEAMLSVIKAFMTIDPRMADTLYRNLKLSMSEQFTTL